MDAPVAATVPANNAAPRLPHVDKAREVSQQFEAFFVGQLMETMSQGIKSNGPMGGGNAERTWRSMQNEEFGKIVAHGRGFGIADAVYGQIIRLQEAATQGVAE